MSDPAAQGGDERELRRLNRALRMLSDSNQALIRITDEAQLLREVCRVAVEVGGYRMAWVGMPENDERKTVRIAAVHGANEGYLESMGIVWADVPRGRGPAGTAIRTGEVRIIHDILTDPSTLPWREAARERGYEAIAALPLLSGGRVLGALSVNAPAAGAFDDEEIKILAELAGDLAFGLSALRTRAEHERAQELLHKSDEVFRAIVENSPDLILRFDRELTITYVNPALCRTFGLPAEAFLNQPIGATTRQARGGSNPAGREQVRETIEAVFADGEPRELEVRWPTSAGERAFSARYFPERDRAGAVASVLAISRDFTERRRAEESLQNVLRHARTVVIQSLVTAPEGWDTHEPEWGAPHYRWESHFEDEAAAQDVMPLELAPGEKYYDGWVRARHPDDGVQMALVAARAFVSGAASWQQEFRAVDRHGQEHWFAQVASVRPAGRGRWHVTKINTDITERHRAEGALQNVLRHARSMVMHGVAVAPEGWDQHPPEWSVSRYRWTAHFMNEAAAQEVMPVELAPGESYHAAWVRARHPEDLGATDLTAARAFVSDATSWRQEFRTIDRHGRLHWFAQVASIRSTGAGRWQVTTINTDVTELRQAERERQEHLWLFENLDRVNRAIQQADTLEQMMTVVLDVLLEVFACDRAWLVFPCDPTAASWQVPMERTRPEYPGALALGVEVPMEPTAAEVMRLVLAQDEPVKFGGSERRAVPPSIAEAFRVRSFIAMALHPRGARPYVFGLHQCTHAREWTPVEEKLFKEVGRRLAGSLSNLLADRALQESRLRLEMANRASQIGPWDWDLVTNEMQFSVEWKRQLGYEPHELAGRYEEWESRLHPDDRERVLAAVRAYLAGERADYDAEFRMRHKDGSYRWIFTRAELMRLPDGRPCRMIGCHLDITERKLAEDELRRRTALFEAQLNSTLDGILVVDSQGTKILQNDRLNELWKIPREVLENPDDTVQVQYVKSRTKYPAAFVEKVAYLYGHPDEVSRDEIELVDGTFLDRYSAPVRDKSGKHYGRIWAFRDVTVTRQLEEQLRQSQKMEAVGQLAGGIAHDFNNLLTVIQLQTSMILLEPALGPAIEQSVQQIKEASTRAANLTRQLLTFSRQNVKQARALDIGEVVTSTTKLLRRVLGEDVSLESRFSSSLPLVHADPGMMEQVLMNLVINARDAMPGGGRLTLSLDVVNIDASYVAQHSSARTGRFVSLAVSDTGSGIPPENLSRIFEPFFTTKDVGRGTGLGLATVYGILQLHQGWVEVESEVGRGSEFRVFLPALDEVAASESLPVELEVRGGTETVLLVEDEEVVRAVATAALQRRGYQVVSAPTAADALRTWEEHRGKFDLLLTDLIMPGGISGQTLAEQLTAIRPGLKVIFTSGYSDEVVTRQLRLTAGENFLPKPYPLEDLLRIVRQKLDEA